ncbi:MAG: hypothetical protein JSU72_04850 [Deltaproteobacteria bacterium]|nr:MAG: hypothetical protein JSU72_04850 [Deltaproteobacteria bacterium]
MRTQTTSLRVTYFPYTFLEASDLKRLILYFENVRLLQVIPEFDPGLPAAVSSSQLVDVFCPLATSSLLRSIGQAHRAYRQLGRVHQGSGLVQLLQSLALQEDLERSRTGLVAHLRQTQPPLAPDEIQRISDAVFLLLAHEFDREHVELDLELARVSGVEAEFHEMVGIGTDEEWERFGLESVPQLESDPPRTQYPYQRLKAWTRVCSSQDSSDPFLPVTTSVEVLGEISERLPLKLSSATDDPTLLKPPRCLLAILPDPQSLSLEDVLEFRQSLSRDGDLNTWWQSVVAAMKGLGSEPVKEDHCQELRLQLQETAKQFAHYWPGPEKPTRFLRLESIFLPTSHAHVAFSLASGLQEAGRQPELSRNATGIMLLLSPSPLQPDDKR